MAKNPGFTLFQAILFTFLVQVGLAQTNDSIIVGADQLEIYHKVLEGKRVAIVGNQTSRVGATHLVDTLLQSGIEVVKVFAPEHGFRGSADAGQHVKDGKDETTGLPIVSLYGKHKKPTVEDFQDVDIVVFDIQDVGVRFYTYISTLHYVMEAAAEQQKPLLVLDRPNPNGFYVDGPVLEPDQKSFVGIHPVPIVHGLTIGEYANMINGERWLKNGVRCNLSVVPCVNYTHNDRYVLPVKPSPNLPDMTSIYLYPSICFFEGTIISVGRGTEVPFTVIGHPKHPIKAFSFTPQPRPGARKPKLKGKKCYGYNLAGYGDLIARNKGQLDLSWLQLMYQESPEKERFFNSNGFFNLLSGNRQLQKQIKAQLPLSEIRSSWEPALSKYKGLRRSYLLYDDFSTTNP